MRIALLGCFAFMLAACTATPEAPRKLEDVTFSMPAADTITFQRNGTFTRRTAASRGERPRVITGSWRLVLPEQQVVLLDGQTAGRLALVPGATPAWRFVPVATVPAGAIAGRQDAFWHLTGQWYVAKASVAPVPGEEPMAGLLADVSPYAPVR